MRIRITGTRAETAETAELLAAILPVLQTTEFAPNREGIDLGEVYLEIQSAGSGVHARPRPNPPDR
ncbi:hypothetical protein [Sciscionella sediminilitoris]|uniref:hypothetical protein n=1 Tax=Sciscionella sediminilitoris TaxID=1445613 RepID=UPI0004DED2AA|nr:hypothetical protein [Sciscionella sp. SE31]